MVGKLNGTHRLIPSRYPPVGIFDEIASPEEIESLYDLESWTNDRISAGFGQLTFVPRDQWVVGVSNATIIMAAFCHPNPTGGRFNTSNLGAWYGSLKLETAIEETIYHRMREFLEVGRLTGKVCMREYLADFDAEFHDIREDKDVYKPLYDPISYEESQVFSELLRGMNSNGIVYKSVRDKGGDCVVCYKPRLILNVTQGKHLSYVWDGSPRPTVSELPYDSIPNQ